MLSHLITLNCYGGELDEHNDHLFMFQTSTHRCEFPKSLQKDKKLKISTDKAMTIKGLLQSMEFQK